MRKILIIIFLLTYSCNIFSIEGFNKESSIDINKVETIYIETSFEDLYIQNEERDNIEIVLNNNKNTDLEISNDKNFKIITRYHGFKLFNFKKNLLTVKIPLNFNGSIKLKTTTRGNIEIKDLNVQHLDLSLSSGDLFVENLSADKLNISTSSGSINLSKTISKTADVKSSSGDINIIKQVGNINTQTSSGNVNIIEIVGNINLKTSSGDVSINNLLGEIIGVTTSGSINVTLSELGGDIKCRLSSGSIQLFLPSNEPDITLKLETNSGSMDSHLPIMASENRDNKIIGTSGSGQFLVTVKTTSGDILLSNI